MRLAYLYPEHLGRPHARVLQSAATVAALAGQGTVHLLVGRFAGLRRRLAALGLDSPPGLVIEPVLMCQPGPGLPAPFSWHQLFHASAAARLTRLARSHQMVALVRHLKLAEYLLGRRQMLGIKIIFEAHEIFARSAREQGMSPQRLAELSARETRVIQEADRVLAISQPLAQELANSFELIHPVTLVPSGVGEEFFRLEPKFRQLDLAAYAGSLSPWKGVDLLLQAAAQVPELRLEILGGDPHGEDWRRLSRLARRLGLGDRLVMRPQAGQDQVRELLGRAGLAVWPGTASRAIGAAYTSPLKLFEYLAAGCAVIAPRVPAATSLLIPGRQAWFFEPDDPDSLASAIRDLLNNPQRIASLGRAGRESARDYTWDARARTIWRVAQELE